MKSDFYSGLEAFQGEGLIKKYLVVGRFTSGGQKNGIEYLHYEKFLKQLWSGQIV